MLRDYGSLDIGTVLAPAIHYARTGWPLHANTVRFIVSVAPLFRDAWRSSGPFWLDHGDVPAEGRWWGNSVLADTDQQLLDEAGSGSSREQRIERVRQAFYIGFVADAIGQFCARTEVTDDAGRSHRGLLTAHDTAVWQPRFEAPTVLDYHGITVCKTGPWGPTVRYGSRS
jgi:gamma-glutamyltranspeptidase/glutathione hydrolase